MIEIDENNGQGDKERPDVAQLESGNFLMNRLIKMKSESDEHKSDEDENSEHQVRVQDVYDQDGDNEVS